MGKVTINKVVAPKEWGKFKKWFKLLHNADTTAEDAYLSLGYKLPKPKEDVREHP